MSSILITGTSRGLGLELVNQLQLQPGTTISTIIATSRAAQPSAALSKLITSSSGRIRYVPLDTTSDTSVDSAVQEVNDILGNNGLDILINNAGIALGGSATSLMKISDLESSFSANVSSVHRVTAKFLPLLRKGDKLANKKKIMNVSSTVGSIGLAKRFEQNPMTPYKVAKAALNMLTVQYAMELGPEGFTVFAVSPGWLKTDLGGEYAELEVHEGASRVVEILLKATNDKDNGVFRDIRIEGHPSYPDDFAPW